MKKLIKSISIILHISLIDVSAQAYIKRPLLGELLEKSAGKYYSPLREDKTKKVKQIIPIVNLTSIVQQLMLSDQQLQTISIDINNLLREITIANQAEYVSEHDLAVQRYQLQKIIRNVRKLKQYSAPLVMLTSKKQGDFVATMVLLRSIIPQTYDRIRESADSTSLSKDRIKIKTEMLLQLRSVLNELATDSRIIQANLLKLHQKKQHQLVKSTLLPQTISWLLPVFDAKELDISYTTMPNLASKKLLTCTASARVYAPCDGHILYVKELRENKYVVFIKNKEALIALTGLGHTNFIAGDQVNIGQVLGNMPSSENNTLHYLYYEIWLQDHEAREA